LASVRANKTKQALRAGRAVMGPFVYLGDAALAELAGLAGFDFVVIDMEHTTRSLAEVQHLVLAAEGADVTPIVRVPEPDEKLILRVLETGAQGIMVPLLETEAEAQRVVSAVRYPPAGTRGTFSHSRPARYGLAASPLAEFMQQADAEVLLIGLIETPAGVENIEAILDAGVDVVVPGRGDLSSFMGRPGEPTHAEVTQAAARVVEAAAARPCWAGMAGGFEADELALWRRRGCQFFIWRDDWSVLLDGWRAGIAARQAALDAPPDPPAGA
jgi:2-keto-3-deoxy-L-rhamnonate aldolase RhmA